MMSGWEKYGRFDEVELCETADSGQHMLRYTFASIFLLGTTWGKPDGQTSEAGTYLMALQRYERILKKGKVMKVVVIWWDEF